MTKVFQFTSIAIPVIGASAIIGCAVLYSQYHSIFSQHFASSTGTATIDLSSSNLESIVDLSAKTQGSNEQMPDSKLTITVASAPNPQIIEPPKLKEINTGIKTTISEKLQSFINQENLDEDKLTEEIDEILKNHSVTADIQQDIKQKIATVKEIHDLKKQAKEYVVKASEWTKTKTENTDKVSELKSKHGSDISSSQNRVTVNDQKISDYISGGVAQKLTYATTQIKQIDEQVEAKEQEQQNTATEITNKYSEMKQLESKMQTLVGSNDAILKGIFDLVEQQRSLSDSEKYKTTVLHYDFTQQSLARTASDTEVEEAFKEYSTAVTQWRQTHNKRVDISLRINALKEEKQNHWVEEIKLKDQTNIYQGAMSSKSRLDGALKTQQDAHNQLKALQLEITDIESKLAAQQQDQQKLEQAIAQKTAIFNNGLIS